MSIAKQQPPIPLHQRIQLLLQRLRFLPRVREVLLRLGYAQRRGRDGRRHHLRSRILVPTATTDKLLHVRRRRGRNGEMVW